MASHCGHASLPHRFASPHGRVARDPEWPAQVGYGIGTHDDWVKHSHHGESYAYGGGGRDRGGCVPSSPNSEGRVHFVAQHPSSDELYAFGMAHMRCKECHEATKYFEKALDYCDQADVKTAIKLFHAIGRAHDGLHNFSLAAQAYLKSRDLAEGIDDDEMMVTNKVAIDVACSRAGHEAGSTGLIYIPSHFA
eukprot:TRINITY_DN18433_c0_g2_i1.p1 TRINITY_DN18433_c0_g2~~TRINITY_DN18433_c0_g2_i1.p1  ORF type:complete len:193 (-),score=29.33 TRINITY_DN18433_c0_g2_i1:277-855(-)